MEPIASHSPHDAVFKHILSHRATARDFLLIHLPGHLRVLCDLRTLQLESGSFIEEDLRASHSDILYSLKTQTGEGYIYALIEHQSSPDRHMAFRLMRYAIAAMQRHLDKGHHQLPLVIPLLFYHGKTSPCPHSMRWLDGFSQPEVAERLYSQNFQLVDITTIPDEQLIQHRRVAMLELLQKHIRQRDMMEISEQLVSILSLGYTNRRQFKTLLNYMLQVGNAADPVAFLRKLAQKVPLKPHKETLMNIAQFLEERGRKQGVLQGMKAGIEKGRRKGWQEGRQEGRGEGQQEAAERIARAMLEDGQEPSQVAKLTGLSLQQLDKLQH
ncbi:Rpn family recombination-promoting nuclease/putative transposase [Klebsiella sp. RHBSTW-00465]|uniref:Rpn family recombination-promoting nuclease/putative transposase n=1 Tax=Klebsiella sp. RHBSTW-00465 TaxID=2742650 RepID=UPI0015F35C79|nr:Rpn family recombination-promoting nuclease/putative transposase [Klebsiella sp. RHBSTW-00465]MBA7848151.1 Rpn family recombination-promoting nuclease/putative transposase [Klebsiella sp. RHBSTW-00465]